MKPSGPGLLIVGRFLTTGSVSILVLGKFSLSISSWFYLDRLYVSKNSPNFFLSYPVHWDTVVHSCLLFFSFLYHQLQCLFFHYLFCLFESFFLSLTKGMSILFTFLKSKFISFSYCFSTFYFIYFCSNYCCLFLFTSFGNTAVRSTSMEIFEKDGSSKTRIVLLQMFPLVFR